MPPGKAGKGAPARRLKIAGRGGNRIWDANQFGTRLLTASAEAPFRFVDYSPILLIKGKNLEMPTFFEFFAGGGMARAGLGNGWSCLFANDFDPKKGAAYAANWGPHELVIRDVATLSTRELPRRADLAWASFPCQDLSLAGSGAGLKGQRSGAFWPFWPLRED